jgi:membrane fusion protein, multidrug efflux system
MLVNRFEVTEMEAPTISEKPWTELKAYPVTLVARHEVSAPSIDAPVSAPVKKENGGKNHNKLIAIAAAALLFIGGGAVGASQWLTYLSAHQETDDAYVTGHLHQVSSRLNGTVEKVLIDDNQHVKKGQIIAVLDPRDFQVKVNEAKAALDSAQRQANSAFTSISLASSTAQGNELNATGAIADAKATITRSEAAVREALAAIEHSKDDVVGKEAEMKRAELDAKRFADLAADQAVSQQQADNAQRDYIVATKARDMANKQVIQASAQYEQALESVKKAKAQLVQTQGQMQLANASKVQTEVNSKQYDVANAAIEQAKANLQEAQLNLSYTVITAPTTGRIGKKSVEVGQRVEPGQPLVTLVSDDLWVVANFKETQLEKMRPHQEVELKVDSFPGHIFKGIVDSVAPGSGSSFAVLPSDNATGNFTKIVQRVPVKVVFDKASLGEYTNLLVPGMSVIVDVQVKQDHHKKA